jgi:fructose-1,6-bisphosphatase/inositol monophosphatase family enzyme
VSLSDPQSIVDRLRHFQRLVRDTIITSRRNAGGAGLHEVSRSSAADTIYKIDTEVDPLLEHFCQEWGRETPLVLIAEGMQDEYGNEGPVVFPHGTAEEDAHIRVIVDPIDGTRGIMYDKRAAWALAGVAPNKGPTTRLGDIEVAVMTELPTSKMGFADVLWAIRGRGAHGVRENLEPQKAILELSESQRNEPIGRVLTQLGKVTNEKVIEALNAQQRKGGMVGQILVGMGYVDQKDVQIALAFQKGDKPALSPEVMSVMSADVLKLRPSQAETINHGFATVSNFFPGTKALASELMEHLVRNLIGPADVTQATVFDDQYISTGGQFYELIVGHDRFNADLRPAFYRLQGQPEGLCCHPYDCAALLIAEEAGVRITGLNGKPLDGPMDTTTGLSWMGYANPSLHRKIEPLVIEFLRSKSRA